MSLTARCAERTVIALAGELSAIANGLGQRRILLLAGAGRRRSRSLGLRSIGVLLAIALSLLGRVDFGCEQCDRRTSGDTGFRTSQLVREI